MAVTHIFKRMFTCAVKGTASLAVPLNLINKMQGVMQMNKFSFTCGALKTKKTLLVFVLALAMVLGLCTPITVAADGFADVPDSAYYAEPVRWAVENSITVGTSATTFSPDEKCTTAQILTFLWRAMGKPTTKCENPFTDVKESDYYYSAALWAYENEIVSGNTLGPNTPCTRSQTVTYLWKCAGKPSAPAAHFSDVSAGADYAPAVYWAVDQGVTNGTSATTFSPNATCTRGQIVTFMHRDMGGAPADTNSANAQSLLGGVPYYGDVSKCKMTAEQASAFAQVIADGIAGKYGIWDSFTSSQKPFFWEHETDVFIYTPYKTNRANVILADLDGSGVPYLYVFSSLVDSCSYDVFGWTNGEAKLAIGDESYQTRGESALYESDNGTVIRVGSGSNGAASHSGETYIFSNGAAREAFSWDVTFDYSSNLLQVTINGKTTDYPASADYADIMDAAISASPYKIVDMAKRNLPYAPFSEVESRPATLRQMMDALKNYASALNGSSSKPATAPGKSNTQLMAQAMLDKISELGSTEAYLLDMNADGTPELVCYDEEIPDSIWSGGYRVYRWDGQKLYEHQFDYFYDYVFNKKGYGQGITKYHNEYALVFHLIGGPETAYDVLFLDHTDTFCDGCDIPVEDERFFWQFNGEEITEERYTQLFKEYGLDEIDRFSHIDPNFRTRTDLPDARTELNKLLTG